MSDDLDRLKAALADRYALEREIGAGGMATVYLAQDLRHDRPVALKVLKPELASAIGPERFLREIKTTARLTHPHILPLLDSGEAAGLLFYVTPYVEGESLRDRLEREGELPVWQGRIAGVLGDCSRAANLLRTALSRGQTYRSWAHHWYAALGRARECRNLQAVLALRE